MTTSHAISNIKPNSLLPTIMPSCVAVIYHSLKCHLIEIFIFLKNETLLKSPLQLILTIITLWKYLFLCNFTCKDLTKSSSHQICNIITNNLTKTIYKRINIISWCSRYLYVRSCKKGRIVILKLLCLQFDICYVSNWQYSLILMSWVFHKTC